MDAPPRLLRLVSRGSPLARAQVELTLARLHGAAPALECAVEYLATTGDQRREWSLAGRGGAGLFTKELQAALLEGRADVAVHSAKDLPTLHPEGLALAGCLPRAPAHDVLVRRAGVEAPALVATGSPRRRAQLARRFPGARFTELRGNVDTRLKKIAAGEAEATVLAAAGLLRLGIDAWPGLEFTALGLAESVPAPGQGAIGLETPAALAPALAPWLDAPTTAAVALERAFLGALGGGCHSAIAAHRDAAGLHTFDEVRGYRFLPLATDDPEAALAAVRAFAHAGA